MECCNLLSHTTDTATKNSSLDKDFMRLIKTTSYTAKSLGSIIVWLQPATTINLLSSDDPRSFGSLCL